jgi:hypothetical protein
LVTIGITGILSSLHGVISCSNDVGGYRCRYGKAHDELFFLF